MKGLNQKTLLLFTSLFLLDLIKPLGYSLTVEFVFLGVIFVSLNEALLPALAISAIFGLVCDFFNPGIKPLSLVGFPLICLLNHYLFSYFGFVNKKTHVLVVKNSLVLLALIARIITNSIHSGLILPFFWIKFLIQSILIYFSMDYLLKCSYRKNDATI
ncbi:MAG: hypothetical protein HQ570_03670 [Candidatus Omnitrophica bacterium]|nr:hypothetical protein [Candidatus Omnitrophota bacterium]